MATLSKLFTGYLAVLVLAENGFSQQFTIQQPVVSQFGVNTSVSIPDRGSVYLGSVGRAGSSRYSTGPFRSGSSAGRFTEHSGAHVSIYIHDLREMDRQILAGSSASNQSTWRPNVRTRHPLEAGLRKFPATAKTATTRPQHNSSTTPSFRAAEGFAKRLDRISDGTRLSDTAYGRARLAHRRNFDRTWSRVQKSRQFGSATNR